MKHLNQAIRDAAELGGYQFRSYKVSDLEYAEGYNGLPMLDISLHMLTPEFWRAHLRAKHPDWNQGIIILEAERDAVNFMRWLHAGKTIEEYFKSLV